MVGVSHVTVSLALRNSPKLPLARRREIQAVAERVGYRPNPMASALAHFKQSSKVQPIQAGLAWLNFWPEPQQLHRHAEFARYWQGARMAAETLGYRLEELVCGSDPPSIARLQKVLLSRGIGGIMLPPQQQRRLDWTGLDWEGFSAVRLGRSEPTPRLHTVAADQVANTILGFNEIRARGYARVGFVSGAANQGGALFEAGFLMAQRCIEKELWVPVLRLEGADAADHRSRLGHWLKRHRPDAVFTEMHTIPGLLRRCGCRVPEDVGLAVTSVLDGNAGAAGIYQNPEEVGRVASQVLVSLLRDNDRGSPSIFRQILVEGAWVDGQTLPDRRAWADGSRPREAA